MATIEEYLSTKQVAELLGLKPKTIANNYIFNNCFLINML